MEKITYDQNEEPIVLSKYTLDRLLKEKNFAELLALYTFYYYTAKWQGTNKAKSTTGYTAKGIGWSEDKVRKYKKQLISLGLIENFKRLSPGKKILGWYIKVNFVWFKDVNEETPKKPPSGKTPPLVDLDPNALNTDSINTLNTLNIADASASSKINLILKEFIDINPFLEWNNLSERKAIEKIVDKHGFDEVINMVKWYKTKMTDKYCPVATKPTAFLRKFGDLVAYAGKQKEQTNQPYSVII